MAVDTGSGFAAEITVTALDADPYPIYRHLRDEEPVVWVPAVELWFVTRWDDVATVTRAEEFGVEWGGSPLALTLGTNVLTVDGDLHRRMRAALGPGLRNDAVRVRAHEVIEPIVEELFAKFKDRGEAELMSELFEPVSVLSLGRFMGLGEIDADTLRRWFSGLATGAANFEGDVDKRVVGETTAAEVDETVTPIIERLKRTPDDSVLSHMIHAELDGGALSREEVLANLKLILLGGMQEPGHAAGNAMYGALTDADARAELIADPGLTRVASEEGMRWLSPVGTSTRFTKQSVTVAGVDLPAGAPVAAVLASANRDERRWSDPDRFDLHREKADHRAFGYGAHFCAGSFLSRYEIRLPFEKAFSELSNLRLDPDREVRLDGWEFRGVKQLPVRWDSCAGSSQRPAT